MAYAATAYFIRDRGGGPAGQFDIRFHIDAGKTTEILLKEADLQPFVDPGKASE